MPQKTKPSDWDVVSTAPVDSNGWDVVSTSPSPDSIMQTSPTHFEGPNVQAPSWLSNPGDIVDTVGQRLQNLVSAPYHAFADGPQNPREQDVVNQGGGGLFGRYVGLPLDRLTGASQSQQNYDLGKSLWGTGNHDPAVQSFEDAVPFVGPWAKQIETDTQNKGALAGLFGLGTDIAAPAALSKGVSLGMKGFGTAMQAASATPESLRLYGTRMLTKGTPGELLQSALKPNVSYGAGVADTLQKSIPSVIEADPNAQGVSGFARAADAARDAQFGQYDDLISPYRSLGAGVEGPTRPSAIHGGPIGQAQMGSIPAMDLLEDTGAPGRTKLFEVPDTEGGTIRMGAQEPPKGGIVQRTRALADKYNRPMSVPMMDAIREDANAKLNAFYNKTGGDQAAALSNPETARVKAVGDTSRQLLYPQLEQDAGLQPGSVAGMQQKYGMLSDTADIANKREPIFARHDPVTLSQKIAVGHGGPVSTLFNWGKERMLNNLTDSDALVNSAIDRYQNPQGTPLTPQSNLFAAGANNLGGAVRSAAPYSGYITNAIARTLFAPKGNAYGQ